MAKKTKQKNITTIPPVKETILPMPTETKTAMQYVKGYWRFATTTMLLIIALYFLVTSFFAVFMFTALTVIALLLNYTKIQAWTRRWQ